MTRTPDEEMAELARLTGEVVQAVIEQEAQVLHLVQAEIAALGALVQPVVPSTGTPEAGSAQPAAARAAEQEAEDEAAFDNMPI
jgi:DNA-binding IclR family transcriptional regulator